MPSTDRTPLLSEIFERHKDREWMFLRGLGNWGDDLLFTGAERLADRIGLTWTSFDTATFKVTASTADHCIYLQGGGGFNKWSSGRAFDNLKLALERQVHTVVQGPLSTGGDQAWLTNKFAESARTINAENFWIFAREEVTYKSLNEIFDADNRLTICIDHDTALSLSHSDLLELAQIESMPRGRYDLVVLREDPEQPITQIHSPLIPQQGIAIDPAYEATSFRHWIRIHLHAKSILTNRLHSSIIGRLADKSVTVSSGSYHKNRTVWEYSLKDAGVQWIETFGAPPAAVWSRLPEWLTSSYKIRKLRLAWHRVPLS